MELGHTVTLSLDFADAVAAVKGALADQGFGIVSELDMQATFKAKIDVDVEPYVILGACRPSLAHLALTSDPAVGLLLPCNVTVRRHGDESIAEFVDPLTMLSFFDSPELKSVAEDAAVRLDAALAALKS